MASNSFTVRTVTIASNSCSVSTNESSMESLECGTSLAEREHGEEVIPDRILTSTSSAHESHFESASSALRRCSGQDMDEDVKIDSISSLRSWIASDVVKADFFHSPYAAGRLGNRNFYQLPLVYCDQTASNRPVQSIDSYINSVCLPYYGNTHTTTSITGSQSTAFCAEARQIVAESTNAKTTGKASLDEVLFAGHGATSAVELLIDCLGIEHASRCDVAQRPVVFVGPMEHHSNLIPWRETGCEIIMIPISRKTGQPDLIKLEEALKQPQYLNRLKIGTFTAASNVTGQVCNVNAIAACMHKNGGLVCFDYATAAPYVKIDMNPPPSETYPEASLITKDAVFLSPHKIIGGIGTPGVLIAKKHLISKRNAPKRSGGGTVFYVNHTSHRFLSNRLERYEGGTPNVSGIIRTGLTFLLKRQVEELYKRYRKDTDPVSLEEYEYQTFRDVSSYLSARAPNLVLLGTHTGSAVSGDLSNVQKLPIFSFLIRWGSRFLHYNYVCAILNDVFGIQSRGGCQCSGPYSQQLLGLTSTSVTGDVLPSEVNDKMERLLLDSNETAEILRPGYTRLSLPFKGLLKEEVDYVIKALVWVSQHGWELICQYRCNHRTGEWRHMSRQGRPLGRTERKWLGYFDIKTNICSGQVLARCKSQAPHMSSVLEQALNNAESILTAARQDRSSIAQTLRLTDAIAVVGGDKLDELRWYVYPQECALVMSKKEVIAPPSSNVEGALVPLELTPKPIDATEKTVVLLKDNDDTSKITVPAVNCYVSSVCSAPKKTIRDSSNWGTGALFQKEDFPTGIPINTDECVESISDGKVKNPCRIIPPQKMMKQVIQAVYQWDMLCDGDRILLGLSGGKDSLSLLHVLLEIKRRLPIKFDLEVCTIDPMTPSFDPSSLIPYIESLGLKYHYVRDDIVGRAGTSGKNGMDVSSLCSFCARMKRGRLYMCARENQCNKVVLAHHLDDCAESFMMSVMHNGFLRTMQANYKVNAGDLSVIRPLVYCRERLMTEFAKSGNLPVINENCPACFEEPKERARMKKLLSREESLFPNFFDNIRRSLIPLMHADSTAILRFYLDETLKAPDKTTCKRKRMSSGNLIGDRKGNANLHANQLPPDGDTSRSLEFASDEELLREIARRKADKYRISGANKFLVNGETGVDDNARASCPSNNCRVKD